MPGLSWVLGDGRQIRFWSDRWLSNSPLSEGIVAAIPPDLVNVCARELWSDAGGWDFTRIMVCVPEEVRLKLLAVVLDNVTGAKDRISWGGSVDGSFTVKSAYALLTYDNSPRPYMGKLFERIWRVVAPERVRVFLWLTANQVIMTNVERTRRHLSDSSLCTVCKSGDETIMHVLRDCPAMSGVWNRIIPQRRVRTFFTLSLLEWLYDNLGDTRDSGEGSWSTLFVMALWWGWKWRCGNVFGVNGKCRDRVRFVKDIAREVVNAHSVVEMNNRHGERVETLVSWNPPEFGGLKLNTDGASHGNPGLATAGGVLRDHNGDWYGGFAVNIGVCSAPLAELWGVYYGLVIAWERGARRVELEVDSAIVVGFLKTGISETHPLSFLVRLCYGFLSKDWVVRISHVYREANRLADGLANYAFSLPLGFHSLAQMPDVVSSIMLEDDIGTTRPRHVRV